MDGHRNFGFRPRSVPALGSVRSLAAPVGAPPESHAKGRPKEERPVPTHKRHAHAAAAVSTTTHLNAARNGAAKYRSDAPNSLIAERPREHA